jgi:hypothetical protein
LLLKVRTAKNIFIGVYDIPELSRLRSSPLKYQR